MKKEKNLKEFFLIRRNLLILTCASLIISGWFIFPITSSFVFEGGQAIILFVCGSVLCYSFVLYIASSNLYILYHEKHIKVFLISSICNLGGIALHILTEWGKVTLEKTLAAKHLLPHIILVPLFILLCYSLISMKRNKSFNLADKIPHN